MPESTAVVAATPVLPAAGTSSVHGPYEDLALALIGLISKAMDGRPEAVRAELWKMHVEDLKAWREFWKGIGAIFKPH